MKAVLPWTLCLLLLAWTLGEYVGLFSHGQPDSPFAQRGRTEDTGLMPQEQCLQIARMFCEEDDTEYLQTGINATVALSEHIPEGYSLVLSFHNTPYWVRQSLYLPTASQFARGITIQDLQVTVPDTEDCSEQSLFIIRGEEETR